MAITQQGADCIGRGSYVPPEYTIVNIDNPATENGTINRIKVWSVDAVTGFETGSFECNDPGTNHEFTCHGNCDGANMSITGGSCVEKAGGAVDFVSYSALDTEYMGHYHADGTIERDTSGFAGYSYYNDDYLSTDDNHSGYTFAAGDAASVYGYEVAAGGAIKQLLVGGGGMGGGFLGGSLNPMTG